MRFLIQDRLVPSDSALPARQGLGMTEYRISDIDIIVSAKCKAFRRGCPPHPVPHWATKLPGTSLGLKTIRFRLRFFGLLRRRPGGRFSSLVTGQMPPTGHRQARQGSLHRLDIVEATSIGQRPRNGRTADAQSPSENETGTSVPLAQAARKSGLCFHTVRL